MIFLFIFLAISLQNGSNGALETAPEDYLNYYRTEDIPSQSASMKFGDIKYTDLLSIMHNDDGNRALLDRIHDNDKLDDILAENERQQKLINDTVSVKSTSIDKDTKNPIATKTPSKKTLDKLNRQNDVIDKNKVISDSMNDEQDLLKKPGGYRRMTDIVPLDEESNLKQHIAAKEFDTKGKGLDTFHESAENSRPLYKTKRSVLGTLNNMFSIVSTPSPKPKWLEGEAVRPKLSVMENSSLAEILANLTESITFLNENLGNLKANLQDNKGFVLIKIPLNDSQLQKYRNHLSGSAEIVTEPNTVRTKRDLDSELDKINVTSTLGHSINDDGILNSTENIFSTIYPKLEAGNDTDHLDLTRRQGNITDREINKTITEDDAKPTIDTVLDKDIEDDNVAEFTETDLNTTEVPNDTKVEVTNERKNDIKQIDDLLNGRRSFESRNELLQYIEQAYRDIKNIITPIADIKVKYSDNVMYKIGYITANLETMEASLLKLRERMYSQGNWEMNRLQKVFKKLYMSKKLVINIMEYLNNYTHRTI